MSLLSLLGCSPRPTDQLPASLRDLQIEITLEDLTERGAGSSPYERTSITAVVRDARGGAAIERADLRVEVNDTPLEFRVSTGNYYDRHPYYRLPENSSVRVGPATHYRFTLVLPDGTRHEIGTIRTPAALELAQIDFATQRPDNGEVTIGWRDLAEPAALVVFRSNLRREADGTIVREAGSANDPAAPRRTIGGGFLRRQRTGQWRVPADFLAPTDTHTASAVSAEIRVEHTASAARTFARSSSLRAERRLTLHMDCEAAP